LRESSRRTRDAQLQLTGWHLGVGTPVVAAVNGICAGGGLHFVVDADIVIASTEATFVDPHVSVGQVSNWEAVGLARRGPFTAAARLVLLGSQERLSAERAHQLGLVSEIVPPSSLREAAQRVALAVAALPVEVAQSRKAALWRGQEFDVARPSSRRT
jgi:enoyl-CoA hydratase